MLLHLASPCAQSADSAQGCTATRQRPKHTIFPPYSVHHRLSTRYCAMRVLTCSSNPNLLQRQSGASSSALHSCKPCINPLTAGLQHSPLVRPQQQRSSWATTGRPHHTVHHAEALSSSGISGLTGQHSPHQRKNKPCNAATLSLSPVARVSRPDMHMHKLLNFRLPCMQHHTSCSWSSAAARSCRRCTSWMPA